MQTEIIFSNNNSSILNSKDYFEDFRFEKLQEDSLTVKNVEFCNCTFANNQFIKCSFLNCRFEDCSFVNTDFSLSIFKSSSFFGAHFKDCKLIGINWTKALKPLKLKFTDCKINDSLFVGLDLRGISMTNCEARNSDFEKANLIKANLVNSDFLNSNFDAANLTSADLTGAVNYIINPNLTAIKHARFSQPEVLQLLAFWEIEID